jgi:predicted membrane channel-forming protein YqfA (hemolysin III family)
MGYNFVKEVNKMNRKMTGQVLMVVGVACGLVYVLASLLRGDTIPVRLSTTLLYAGIISLIAGLVFYGLAGVRRLPSGRRY